MSDITTGLLYHTMAVQACLPAFGGGAVLDLKAFVLDVRARGRRCLMLPQFVFLQNGQLRYSPSSRPDVFGFIGWRPYCNKRWPAGCGKFAFKKYCIEHSLPTPHYSLASADGMDAWVVKKDDSSFGIGLAGPFHQAQSGGWRKNAGDKGYFEEYIAGAILKAWLWNDRLLCLESLAMPTVTGDGTQTVRELIVKSDRRVHRAFAWDDYEQMVRFQDARMDDIEPVGRTLLVDFRYGSALHPPSRGNTNVLPLMQDGAIVRQFREFGPTLARSIPKHLWGSGTLYSVDAIADAEDKVWLLEMNSNPQLHPDVYFGMFEGLFGPADSQANSRTEIGVDRPPQPRRTPHQAVISAARAGDPHWRYC